MSLDISLSKYIMNVKCLWLCFVQFGKFCFSTNFVILGITMFEQTNYQITIFDDVKVSLVTRVSLFFLPIWESSEHKYRWWAHFLATDLALLQWWSELKFSRRIPGPSHEVCSQSVVTSDWLGSFQAICLIVWFPQYRKIVKWAGFM